MCGSAGLAFAPTVEQRRIFLIERRERALERRVPKWPHGHARESVHVQSGALLWAVRKNRQVSTRFCSVVCDEHEVPNVCTTRGTAAVGPGGLNWNSSKLAYSRSRSVINPAEKSPGSGKGAGASHGRSRRIVRDTRDGVGDVFDQGGPRHTAQSPPKTADRQVVADGRDTADTRAARPAWSPTRHPPAPWSEDS